MSYLAIPNLSATAKLHIVSIVDKQPEEVKTETCWKVSAQLEAMALYTWLRLHDPILLIRMQK